MRSGASEVAIADYQRQELAVLYLVLVVLLSHSQFCCVERVRGSYHRGLQLLQLLFEFNMNVRAVIPLSL